MEGGEDEAYILRIVTYDYILMDAPSPAGTVPVF